MMSKTQLLQWSTRFPVVRRKAKALNTLCHAMKLRTLLENHRIDLVIDAGANMGQFVKEDLRPIYKGEVLSFEPVKATFESLQANSRKDNQWKSYNYALGRENCAKKINVSASSLFNSFLPANEFSNRKFGSESVQLTTETVEIRRIDELLKSLVPDAINRRIFLKMDTQGFDLEVFEGATNLLPSVFILQSEVSCIPIYSGMPHWGGSVKTYEQAGFGLAGLFPVSSDTDCVIEFDCLMTRARNEQ